VECEIEGCGTGVRLRGKVEDGKAVATRGGDNNVVVVELVVIGLVFAGVTDNEAFKKEKGLDWVVEEDEETRGIGIAAEEDEEEAEEGGGSR